MSGTRRDFLCQVAGAGGYRATYLTMQAMGLLGTTAASEPLALATGLQRSIARPAVQGNDALGIPDLAGHR